MTASEPGEQRPLLTVIAGPTASGKSALALELAEATGAELVSADSQQVYRHFDLGTAKPTDEELARVRHHVVSVVDPMDAFDAARFQELADAAIADITARGKRVIVVGGTGLYLRILLHGVVPAPDVDPALRARLEAEAEAHGNAALHARLASVDPTTAARLHPADRLRVSRALELFELTGRPPSELYAEHRFAEQRYRSTFWVLEPAREVLYARINERAKAMFDGGLVEEAADLVRRGYREAAPMRSVGYTQALDVLEGRLTREEGLAAMQQATRQYAKRQLTWFRKEPSARMLTPPYAESLRERGGLDG